MGPADPRSFGSKNPSATNVLRTGNKTAAALTLLGDAAKGWLAVFIAAYVAQRVGIGSVLVAGCAIAAFLGHVFPIFLKLKGGKGVGTALCVVMAINPWMELATEGTWLTMEYVTRYT